ncbi:MAG: HEAT repeat domain-containing protein [Nitrososphaerota archaeon]|nr:HEAT repeat domain-containing protein [Nitrososphaerota archaeon]
MYTGAVIDDEEHCLEVMGKMEEEYGKRNEGFFVKVIREEESLVLRVHAVTILAEIGGEAAVEVLSDVLLHDTDPLVKHEAAFSMGQMGLSSANPALEKAVLTDPDPVVRHESAAALGAIGSQSSRATLEKALKDGEDIVKNSAEASLFNLRFLARYSSLDRERMAPRP